MRSRLTTPGSTQAMRLSRSTSRIRFIRVSDDDDRPAERDRPARQPGARPAGTTARPWRAAILTIGCTSAVDVGKQTGPATPPRNTEASRLNSDRSAASVRTLSTPIADAQVGDDRIVDHAPAMVTRLVGAAAAPPGTEHHRSQYGGHQSRRVALAGQDQRAASGAVIENAGMMRGAAETT